MIPTEPGADSALVLRDEHFEGRIRLLAPSLIAHEVTAALRHHPGMNPSQLRASVRRFFDLQLTLVAPSRVGLSPAAKIALKRDLTIYDASYGALAVERGCPLVIEDLRLLRVSDRAILPSKCSTPH